MIICLLFKLNILVIFHLQFERSTERRCAFWFAQYNGMENAQSNAKVNKFNVENEMYSERLFFVGSACGVICVRLTRCWFRRYIFMLYGEKYARRTHKMVFWMDGCCVTLHCAVEEIIVRLWWECKTLLTDGFAVMWQEIVLRNVWSWMTENW